MTRPLERPCESSGFDCMLTDVSGLDLIGLINKFLCHELDTLRKAEAETYGLSSLTSISEVAPRMLFHKL